MLEINLPMCYPISKPNILRQIIHLGDCCLRNNTLEIAR